MTSNNKYISVDISKSFMILAYPEYINDTDTDILRKCIMYLTPDTFCFKVTYHDTLYHLCSPAL